MPACRRPDVRILDVWHEFWECALLHAQFVPRGGLAINGHCDLCAYICGSLATRQPKGPSAVPMRQVFDSRSRKPLILLALAIWQAKSKHDVPNAFGNLTRPHRGYLIWPHLRHKN